MLEYNLFEARQNFSKIIEQIVKNGKECIINKSNQHVAKIVPMSSNKSPRKLGLMKNKIKISDDFDDPLPSDVLDSFDGGCR